MDKFFKKKNVKRLFMGWVIPFFLAAYIVLEFFGKGLAKKKLFFGFL
ncbi:MAG: hypothetical protein MR964_04150 [Campylobacter sp.]|nr:hypothetical protein [Campylobacter sp.]MCI7023404.1 hypothetical protein [Campylobacter sp.]